MRVRPAVQDDAEAIADITSLCWTTAYRGLFPDEYLDDPALPAARRNRWRSGIDPTATDPEVRVVDDPEGGVVAWASYGTERGGGLRGELWGLYCHPARWGAGAGDLLLEHALTRLTTRGR